jgi:hypothetical protein
MLANRVDSATSGPQCPVLKRSSTREFAEEAKASVAFERPPEAAGTAAQGAHENGTIRRVADQLGIETESLRGW